MEHRQDRTLGLLQNFLVARMCCFIVFDHHTLGFIRVLSLYLRGGVDGGMEHRQDIGFFFS